MKHMLFKLGQIVMTPGVEGATTSEERFNMLKRHVYGDWGIVSKEDAKENELSLREGFRILSAYMTKHSVKVWIVTEASRECTTLLLPSEY